MNLTLNRLYSSDEGTVGLLSIGIFILELPDRDNEPQFSRILEGIYSVKWGKSPRFGLCYHVTEVPSRGNILIHKGNLAGDTRKGLLSHSHGCLLPCMKIGKIDGQLAGLLSSIALKKLYSVTKQKDFILEIKNA